MNQKNFFCIIHLLVFVSCISMARPAQGYFAERPLNAPYASTSQNTPQEMSADLDDASQEEDIPSESGQDVTQNNDEIETLEFTGILRNIYTSMQERITRLLGREQTAQNEQIHTELDDLVRLKGILIFAGRLENIQNNTHIARFTKHYISHIPLPKHKQLHHKNFQYIEKPF